MTELPDHAATVVARLDTGPQAQQILDVLGETFDPDEAVVAAFETAPGRWTVSIHFLNPPNETAVRAVVGLAVDAAAANALAFERVAGRDWVQASLDGLPPVHAGRFTVHGSHDSAAVGAQRIGIEIEAALAFGTGHHGTTRGCLLALDALIKRGRLSGASRILDVGTGTGVLAMAAARALHAPVLASDIDRTAVRVARENARRNRAAVTFIHAKGVGAWPFRRRAPYNLILANILLLPLQRLAAPLQSLTAPGARIVLSGLLTEHQAAALAAYRAQGLFLERRILLDGWATLILRRGR